MAEVKKTEVAKAEEMKATKEVAAEKKVAEKKEPAKKTTTKATAKTVAKTTTKKPATKKTTKKATEKIVIQFGGSEFDLDAIKASVKDAIKAEKVKANDVRIYIKPEDNKAYYVADEHEGCIDLQ